MMTAHGKKSYNADEGIFQQFAGKVQMAVVNGVKASSDQGSESLLVPLFIVVVIECPAVAGLHCFENKPLSFLASLLWGYLSTRSW
jgi:hypothetical protein